MAISIIALALMPISQVVSWYLVLSDQRPPLYTAIFRISSFYCAWAIYNRFFVAPQELGYISMGCLIVASYFEKRTWSMAAVALILVNFILPAFMIFPASAAELAMAVKNDDSQLGMVWAWVFKLYFVSHISLWCLVFSKLNKTNDSSYAVIY